MMYMKKNLGYNISKIAGVLMVVGAIGTGYAMFTGCKYPPVCEDGTFWIPFGTMFFVGVGLLFLGTKFSRKDKEMKKFEN